jgi:hypothetical protein
MALPTRRPAPAGGEATAVTIPGGGWLMLAVLLVG